MPNQIYVLFISGCAHSYHLSLEEAYKKGVEIGEPTCEDENETLSEFHVEEWLQGNDIQYAESFEYEVIL